MRFLKILIFFITITQANDNSFKILIFTSYSHTIPWSQQFMQGINEFNRNSSQKIEFYLETIDYIRLKKQMKSQEWEEYLKKKYTGTQFDGIIVESTFASNIFSKFVDKLYKDIPIVHLSTTELKKQKNILQMLDSKEKQIQKTIELAKYQNKNLKNIYLIKPTYINGKITFKQLTTVLKKESFNLVILENFTIKELQKTLSNLPENSVIFYILNFQDKSGKKFIPKYFLEQIAQSANAPIYSFWSTFIGSGCVGGYMIDGVTTAQVSIKNIIYYIQNGHFLSEAVNYNLFLDYEVLKKFELNNKKYDKEAIMINKPISVWKSHPKETLFALSTIALLSLLLILTYFLKVRNEKILKMEESMFVQSKQAAMGEMISVIAHQWRQPLNNISVIVQTILLKYKKNKIDDTIMEKFKIDILKQIHYMSDTIDDFKNFYKPDKQKSTFDIKQELIKTIELVENSYLKENIKIYKNSINSFETVGYPNELSHCFLILLQNAKDALNEVDKNDKVIHISTKEVENAHMIIFENNGNQIADEIKDKIFEPYFSTKIEKNGTGIGLYMAKTIIEKHLNGSLKALNTSNGVKFEIRLEHV